MTNSTSCCLVPWPKLRIQIFSIIKRYGSFIYRSWIVSPCVWSQYANTLSFDNTTPLEVVIEYGKEYLVQYLDHKRLGGYE